MYKTRLFKFLLVVFISFLSFNQAEASHLGAGDIWAVYYGDATHPLRYIIFLDVYRACEPNQSTLSDEESVHWYSDSCNYKDTLIPMTMISDDTLDQLCPNYKSLNSCRQPTSIWPGFEKRRYSDTVELPYRCVDWVFYWEEGDRNGGVLNLCEPLDQDIRVECRFNDLFSDVSTPQFTDEPIPYLCINQPDQFFNGPFDPNGDSLVVENVEPIGCTFCTCGPNGEIPYSTTIPTGGLPYTLINPIQSQPAPYIVDPITGIATFTPSLLGKFVLAFKCSKYDHNTKVLLGSTRRDVQVSVLSCNAPPPNIDSIPHDVTGGLFNPTDGNIIYTCANSPVSFTMHASSISGTNNVFLNIDTSISNTPGNIFSIPVNGAPVVNGTFTWTPGDTSLGVHTIVFISTDSTCNNAQPIVLKSYLVVTIDVIPGINAIPKIYRNCLLSASPVTLNVTGLPTDETYNWTDINGSTAGIVNPHSANPQVHPKDTIQYIVTVNLPPSCKNRDTVTVNVDTSNHITITPATPVILCQEGTVHLTATPIGHKPTANLPCGVPTTPDITTPDSSTVIPSLGAYVGATGANYSCSPFTGNVSSHHQYLIRAADMLNSGMISGVLTSLSFSVKQITAATTYNNVSISLMCTPLDQLPSSGSLLPGGTLVFSAPSVSIAGTGFQKFAFNTFYNWDTTQNLLVDICYTNPSTTATPPQIDFFSSGYPSSYFVYSDTSDVCAGGTATTGGYPLYQLPVILFNYYDAPTVDFPYAWQRVYGSNLFSDSTSATPVAYIDQSTRYYVISRGKSGCTFRDSVNIFLDPPRHPYVLPFDTSVCANIGVELVASAAKNGYKWYQDGNKPATSLSCDNCQKPIAMPDSNMTYTTVFSDSVKCIDTAYSSVKIIPYPKIKIVNNDTTIKYGSSIQLAVASGVEGSHYAYVWTPPFTLDNQYIANPIATPAVPTVYSVIAYNQFCPAYDTVNVNIDYRSNILVPSAFTPNHDGKNDVFRIANITYERVVEFRVFNRWGQQIYTATDNHGWDGTWNGVLMDIGTYSYIIRVVYPDGVEDNFTGNVTLIR